MSSTMVKIRNVPAEFHRRLEARLILDTPTGRLVAGRLADPAEGLHVPHPPGMSRRVALIDADPRS